MMKIAFNIGSPVDGAFPKLIAKVSCFKCRLQVDLKNGIVIASDVDPLSIDNVIESVNDCFEIIGIDIDTTDVDFEAENLIVEEKAGTENPVIEVNSADDLSFKKINFENADVENHMNRLLKIIYWMMYKKHVPAKEMVKHLLTTGTEISMRFNPNPLTTVNIGDIVDCHYGIHLNNEISGGHVHALVCNLVNNSVFIIPITKQIIEGQFYLPFSSKDVIYVESDKYSKGTLILHKGSYVSIERFHEVIGKALPEFFNKVIAVLPKAYYFESINSVDTSFGEETIVSDKDISQFENVEDALTELIGKNIKLLDKNSDLFPQLDNFLISIGMSNNNLLKQAFISACKVKTIKYESILTELKNYNPQIKEDEIKQLLKDTFPRYIFKQIDIS